MVNFLRTQLFGREREAKGNKPFHDLGTFQFFSSVSVEDFIECIVFGSGHLSMLVSLLWLTVAKAALNPWRREGLQVVIA